MIDMSRVKNGGARELAPNAFNRSVYKKPAVGATASTAATPAAPAVTATPGTSAAPAAAPSTGMTLPYKTPGSWGSGSDWYASQRDAAPAANPYLTRSLDYSADVINRGGLAGSMDDFTRAYDQKYAMDKSDTRDQVMESMNAEGLGDSSVGGVQMARELGKLDLQRSQDFADRQTALDEAAKSRIMSAIGAYGGQANQAVSADQTDRAYRAAMNEGAIGVGDREWQSLQDVNNMYTGLSSAYDSANYNPADQAYQSLLTADMGTTKPMQYDEGTLGRIGGVVGGVGSMINNGYFKRKKPSTATPGYRFTGEE